MSNLKLQLKSAEHNEMTVVKFGAPISPSSLIILA
jgi:hypothetical protein